MKAYVIPIRWAVPIAVGAVLAARGAVYAGIPDSSGVIHGCYKKASPNQGTLRVIDTEKGQMCLSSETPLNWNAQGSAGPQGPVGPPGISGYERVLAGNEVPPDTQSSTFARCAREGRSH